MEAEAYRRYCLESVSAAYDVVLITSDEPSWEVPFIRDCVVVPDPTDQAALSAAGWALADRYDLAGVFTWTEWYLVPVARLARQLGLRTAAPEVMQACRNKATARSLFARHGVPSTASVSVRTRQEAQAAAERIGYPVVLKPAAHAASVGVIRVDGHEQVAAAYDFAARAAGLGAESTSVLVEEYLDGPEVSAECVTYRGETTVVAITRKTLSAPPFFEELAHSVDASDPLIDVVAPAARAAIGALGITDGVSHVEMRLVHDRPRLIEVNGRIAGDMIGYLVRLATGIDLPRVAADIACDRTPDLTPTRSSAAAIHLIYPATSGTLTALRFDGPRPPWLEQISFQRSVGDRLLLPPEGDMFSARIGFLITTGDCAEDARHRGQEVLRALTFHMAPHQVGQGTGADPLA
ncbi:ATP-grasp domain-containing protein [Streptomyces ipomoeae]|uniref:ATP-grasp domain-containing protein n=1 Tax=Streptomyces ipomoeae TaxID=103232 RepID=UPI0029B5C3D2|nr:ATP-grasp domain-containing protein [Streptomyces ipomoeae]MDX2821056.1 ATP-grasp domain-containing protein [Streptomyces ipomoeae]MDX2876408.1 ATP-grasp domain-containing protein [Streptomyces ipomoeae]